MRTKGEEELQFSQEKDSVAVVREIVAMAKESLTMMKESMEKRERGNSWMLS